MSIIKKKKKKKNQIKICTREISFGETMTITADWLQLPGALILLMVVAPSLFADTIRDNWVCLLLLICLAIVCYLLQEHIRAGGFINSFTRANGLSNTIGIVLLFVYPIWHWYLMCYKLTLSSI